VDSSGRGEIENGACKDYGLADGVDVNAQEWGREVFGGYLGGNLADIAPLGKVQRETLLATVTSRSLRGRRREPGRRAWTSSLKAEAVRVSVFRRMPNSRAALL
jgi:hypothetical protein